MQSSYSIPQKITQFWCNDCTSWLDEDNVVHGQTCFHDRLEYPRSWRTSTDGGKSWNYDEE